MLIVSTALPTLLPPGTAAPAKGAGGIFQDALDGLSVVPVAVPLLVVSAIKVAEAASCAVAPTTTDIPDIGEVATALSDPVSATEPIASPDADDPIPPILLPIVPSKRQALADGGKPLPVDAAEDDPTKDVIWLPVSPFQPVETPVARSPASPKVAPQIVSVATSAPGPAAVTVAHVLAQTDHVGGASLATTTPTAAGAQLGEVTSPSLPSPDGASTLAGMVAGGAPIVPVRTDPPTAGLSVTVKADRPVRLDNAAAVPAQPVPIQQVALPPTPAILPAGQAFASAIAAVVQQGRDEREPNEAHAPLALATTTLERLHAPAVAAPADVRRSALDLRQDSGLQGMIDHIEVLRDGANAGDTRIRLVPDALGAVDVSVRRDGERLHVHFTAETQASARLIADAQPRLAELADARGVKLGQTSVGSGGVDSGGGQQREQQQPTPIQFTRPATAADSIETPDDLRVA